MKLWASAGLGTRRREGKNQRGASGVFTVRRNEKGLAGEMSVWWEG
jgi:hypothetical protein